MEKSPLTYSIAIRTLGTGGEKYRILLESITTQTLAPERVVVYIAEGYDIPNYRIGKEEYVVVPKGMAKQRILPYQEISSDCILLLDDDVRLGENAAENLVQTLSEQEADCVGADTFRNQDMSWVQKMKALLLGGVYPSWNDNYAFRVLSTGAFSYNNHPQSTFFLPISALAPPPLGKGGTFPNLN